jgi:hypothetical protein
MATDRALTSVLQAFQTVHDPAQTNKILSTTAYLLTALSNPLNITLLTSQLLIAPAVWNAAADSQTFIRIIGIINTAAITILQNERGEGQTSAPNGPIGRLKPDEWARAVIKGADEKSPRWRHVLVIAGVLLGMEGQTRRGLSSSLRSTLEKAMVTASNLALSDFSSGVAGQTAVLLALSHSFDLLSDGTRAGLDHNLIAPVAVHTIIGAEGYQDGAFLQVPPQDIRMSTGSKIDWPAKSPSFLQLQRVASRPAVSAMGLVSKLAGHALANMTRPQQIPQLLDELAIFTRSLLDNWQANRLSTFDRSEEKTCFSPETNSVTLPVLWQQLRTALFAIVNVLRAVISRSLVDPTLVTAVSPQATATKTLHVLRNLYLIYTRLGSNTLSAYNFCHLASIDILSRSPSDSRSFLVDICPSTPGLIPAHPVTRVLDLYFLNTAEHFTRVLSAADNSELIIPACMPYLNPSASSSGPGSQPQSPLPNLLLRDLHEASHSTLLSLFATPQNEPLTLSLIPTYVSCLFASFPGTLSPRQFRLAFRTLVSLASPPARLSAAQPELADTLLEVLRARASTQAGREPLPAALVIKGEADSAAVPPVPLSEQAELLLALLDALPCLHPRGLEEWLPLAAELLWEIPDERMRERI